MRNTNPFSEGPQSEKQKPQAGDSGPSLQEKLDKRRDAVLFGGPDAAAVTDTGGMRYAQSQPMGGGGRLPYDQFGGGKSFGSRLGGIANGMAQGGLAGGIGAAIGTGVDYLRDKMMDRRMERDRNANINSAVDQAVTTGGTAAPAPTIGERPQGMGWRYGR